VLIATANAGGVVTTELREGADPVTPHSLSPRELKELLATERRGEPFLALRDADGRLRLHVLGRNGDTSTVGRRKRMDVSLDWDSAVSGVHAELKSFGGEWTLLDDGLSTNGTYVNGERISGHHRLRDGDRIRMGRTILVYNAAQPEAAGTTEATGSGPPLPKLTDTQRRVLIALCRPYRDGGSFAIPASNQQISSEVFLSLDAVKAHLRALFNQFGLGDLPQNEKRARLAEFALRFGLISRRELG